jgi:hypothetical protein
MLGDELRKLQLRGLQTPHHMISSKTMGGIELLRATLSATLPEAIIKRGRRAQPPADQPSAAASASPSLDDVATPAARAFAEKLAEQKAARAAPQADATPPKRGAEAARERAARALGGSGGVDRERQLQMARDISRVRIARRRERNRAARQVR